MPDEAPPLSARPRRTPVVLATLATLAVGSIVGLLVALTTVDLGRFQGHVEALLSKALGLELRTGELHLDVDLDGTATVSARQVRLTNPTRADDRDLLTVDRLDGRLELWPLHDLRIAIHDLSVSGARVVVVVDEQGRTNWAKAHPAGRRGGPPRIPTLELRRVVLERTTTSVATPGMESPLEVVATRLELSTSADDMVALDFDGAVAGRVLGVRGTVGPMPELLVAGAVRGDLKVVSGAARGTLTGGFGRLGALAKPELQLALSAPSLDEATRLVGLPGVSLGGGALVLTGTMEPSEAGVRIVAHGTLGELEARVRAQLDALAPVRRCDLDVEAAGPNLAEVATALGGSRFPARPFTVRGGLTWAGFPIGLRDVEVRVGDDRLTVSGACGPPPDLVGSDLRLAAEGPDATDLGAILGIALPSLPYHLSASVLRHEGGLDVAPLELELGGDRLTATGTVGDGPHFQGTDLAVDASGSRLELAGTALGLDLPEGPFEISGRVGVESDAVTLHEVRGVITGADLTADGRIGLTSGLEGTSLVATLSGADAALPLSVLGIDGGHGLDYAVSGAVRVAAGRIELDDVAASVGEMRGTATGHLEVARPAEDLDLDLELEGSRLNDLALFGAPSDLPTVPFSASGRVRVADRCLRLDRFAVTLERAHRIRLQGWLALRPGLVGSDLRLGLSGPDLGELGRICETIADLPELPPVPYDVTLDAAVEEHGVELRELFADLELARVETSGHVGVWPDLEGTEIEIRAEGPDLADVARLLGETPLPPLPFSGAGRLSWGEQELKVDDLDLHLGGSDAAGQLRLAVGARPNGRLRLTSEVLDLRELRGSATDGFEARSPAPGGEARPDRVFTDEPLRVFSLETADAELDWRIGRLRFVTTTFADVAFTASLDHGRLEVGPIDARGARGGRVHAALSLQPGSDDFGLEAAGSIEGARADLTLGAASDDDRLAVVDATLDLRARGASSHQLAASSSGRFVVSVSGGMVNRGLVDRLGEGLIRSILTRLNPFASADSTPVALDCAVLVADVAEGRLVLDPMVLKTSNLTIVGHGSVDLATEKLDLEWVAKPRKGIGLSASTFTNPYVKLTGTLANPSIGVKKMEALASTGAALATGGLTILGRGIYERLSADADVCGQALDAVRASVAESPNRPPPG